MAKSRLLLIFCISFIAGIFLSSIIFISQLFMLGLLILAVSLISTFWRYKKIVIVGFSLLLLVLGILRFQIADFKAQNNDLKEYADQEQKIVLLGTIIAEPEKGQSISKITIRVEQIIIDGQQKAVFGKVLISTGKYPEYQYGDQIKAKGVLKSPSEDISGFNYKNYLKKEGIYSVMDWPETELAGNGFGSPLIKTTLSFKNKFEETSRRYISLPQEGLLEALIFGDESDISKGLKEKFNLTGTRHITAVSGMNITIIASLLLSFILSLGFWRKQAFYITVFLLIFYVLMIGAPASAVRAGIMAFFFLLAQHLGRLSSAGRAIVLAAALMLVQNPFLLTLDVGFQLSFLAIMGIVYLQPIFSNWLFKIPDLKVFPLKSTLTTTLSAQIFTLPILIYNFGYVPLISPLVNVLIVPFLAPITILIFIFGLSAILFWPLGYLFSWLVWLSLTYIIGVIEFFSKIPFASLSIKELPLFWLAFFYLVLGLITWRLNKKYSTPIFLR